MAKITKRSTRGSGFLCFLSLGQDEPIRGLWGREFSSMDWRIDFWPPSKQCARQMPIVRALKVMELWLPVLLDCATLPLFFYSASCILNPPPRTTASALFLNAIDFVGLSTDLPWPQIKQFPLCGTGIPLSTYKCNLFHCVACLLNLFVCSWASLDTLTEWLIDCLTDWLTGWLAGWLADRVNDIRLVYCNHEEKPRKYADDLLPFFPRVK